MDAEQKTEQSELTRWFGLRLDPGKTEVQVAEFCDGSIQINLATDRDGMEPLLTSMRLRPVTFALLSEALFRAAHDSSIWRTPKEPA